MKKKETLPDKKAHRLPLASMSEHYSPIGAAKKSGKHRSQEIQKKIKRARNKKSKPK